MKLNKIKNMCRTMKELERVVADYRSMKAMKEQIDAEVKSLEYEINTMHLVYIRRYQPEPVAPDKRRRKDGRSYLRGLPA